MLEWVTAEALAAFSGLALGEVASDAAGVGLAGASEALRELASSDVDVASVCAFHAPGGKDCPGGAPPPGARGGPAEESPSPATATLPPFLRPLLVGLDDADAFEIDARLRRVLRLEQRLEAEIAPLLRCAMSQEYAWWGPRPTLASYAREVLGMSPRKARALLRIERVGDACPELRSAWRDAALSWVQAQTLARLVEPGEADHGFLRAWVAWAPGITVRRLAEDVEQALLLRDADPGAWASVREHPERLAQPRSGEGLGEEPAQEDAERQTCAHSTDLDAVSPLRVTAPREVVTLFRRVLCSVRIGLEREIGRLPSEAQAFDALLDHALRAWDVDDTWLKKSSRRKQYAIFERDGWRCTVPGCTSRRNLHAHHIVFRSAGGNDAPENLTTLCAFHHQRGVHAGRVGVTGTAPGGLWFELGTREGRPPLARYRAGDCMA